MQTEGVILVPSDKLAQPKSNSLYAQPDILSRGRFSKSHLYNLMARGHFPQPVLRMGPRFTRWSVSGWRSHLAEAPNS